MIYALVNPRAGAGDAARRVPNLLRELERRELDHRVVETSAPGEATLLAREARDAGATCIIVVGGDGTLNEVVQAYVAADGSVIRGPELALLPAGTGGDFRRTLGLPAAGPGAAARALDATPRAVDLGVVRLTDTDGSPVVRAFVNVMSFGISGVVDGLVNRGPKWVGGRAAFFVATLRALVVYRNAPVRVMVDGEVLLNGPILNVAVANGRYFGGGMQVAPDADPSDGLFDVIGLADLSRLEGLSLSAHIYRGSHVGRRGIVHRRGKVVVAEPLVAGSRVLIDLDGETPGQLPLTASIAEGALRFRV